MKRPGLIAQWRRFLHDYRVEEGLSRLQLVRDCVVGTAILISVVIYLTAKVTMVALLIGGYQ